MKVEDCWNVSVLVTSSMQLDYYGSVVAAQLFRFDIFSRTLLTLAYMSEGLLLPSGVSKMRSLRGMIFKYERRGIFVSKPTNIRNLESILYALACGDEITTVHGIACA
jgi:hypothetical protein